MALTTPTDFYSDLSDGTFTATGTSAFIDGQYGTGTAANSPTSASDFTSTEKPLADGGGTNHSIGCWMRVEAGAEYTLLAQQTQPDHATLGGFQILTDPSGRPTVYFYTNATNYITSKSSVNIEGTGWRWISANVVSGNLNIFFEGVETAYTAQDGGLGTYTGMPAGVNALSIGGPTTGSFGGIGDFERPKFWANTTLTDANHLEEYTAELAAMPSADAATTSPLLTPLLDPTLGSMYGSDLFLSE